VRSFAALARRELGVYFVSPIAYIILTVLLFFSGLVFAYQVDLAATNRLPFDFSSTLAGICWVVVVASALITMRLVAEEKSRGTIEIMLTAPVTETQFVLAKFAAALVLLAYLLLPTVAFVLVVSMYGQVDAGAVACGYLGVLLVGAFMFSIGIFVSSLCSSQVTAGMITLVVGLVLLILTIIAMSRPEGDTLRRVIETVDLTANFMDFLRGVVDVGRLVYLLGVPVFFLFLTTRVLESRRWR
jgi:ABC-2 type transport system permease protein